MRKETLDFVVHEHDVERFKKNFLEARPFYYLDKEEDCNKAKRLIFKLKKNNQNFSMQAERHPVDKKEEQILIHATSIPTMHRAETIFSLSDVELFEGISFVVKKIKENILSDVDEKIDEMERKSEKIETAFSALEKKVKKASTILSEI